MSMLCMDICCFAYDPHVKKLYLIHKYVKYFRCLEFIQGIDNAVLCLSHIQPGAP